MNDDFYIKGLGAVRERFGKLGFTKHRGGRSDDPAVSSAWVYQQRRQGGDLVFLDGNPCGCWASSLDNYILNEYPVRRADVCQTNSRIAREREGMKRQQQALQGDGKTTVAAGPLLPTATLTARVG